MGNDKKNPDLNSKNPPLSKPDSNINKTSPGSSTGSKGNSNFGDSSRNSGKDMNKDMDKKPGRAGFDAPNRDADIDRAPGIKRTENEVSGGNSSKGSPTSGSSRNH
jgi:hypothetical protein